VCDEHVAHTDGSPFWQVQTKSRQINLAKSSEVAIARFLWQVLVGSQEHRRILFFFPLLSYLICSQIWLNHHMDDHHFSYIRKLAKKREKKTLNLWFWNIEISCSQWEGSACTQSALIFFLLSFGGGGGKGPLGREDFFIFPLFSTCSQWVPIRFPIGSQCVVPQGCSQ
jgi:hypothetical protein